MKASKLHRSAKLTELQLRTQRKNPVIQSLMLTMLTAAVIESIARTKSMTRLSKKSKIERLKYRSGD
jgi:hypothetical protein